MGVSYLLSGGADVLFFISVLIPDAMLACRGNIVCLQPLDVQNDREVVASTRKQVPIRKEEVHSGVSINHKN